MNWQIKTRVWGRAIPKSGWRIRSSHINRIYYIHSGTAYAEINQTRIQLLPGNMYLLPEGIRFTVWMSDINPIDHVYFDFDIIPCFHLKQILQIKVADYPLVQKWLSYAEEIFRTYYGHHWEPEILALINSSLNHLLFILSQIAEIPTINDPRILDTMRYIQEHLEEPMTIETLSSRFYLDKHYFIRLFSKITGQSPHRYIQNKRMNRAISLLQNGSTARQAADACGFGSYSAFARAFRSCYNCSPKQYLNKNDTARLTEATYKNT